MTSSTSLATYSTCTEMASLYGSLAEHELILEESIGKGGFGEIWRGSLRSKPVAVKRIHQCFLDDEKLNFESERPRLKAFKDECNILRTAEHPNIVQFVGMIEDHQKWSFGLVMELMSQTLKTFLLGHKGKLSREKQVDITVQIASGLRYLHLHEPQILHRDLTSWNVLVDEEGRIAKISDFGQSKFRPPDIQYLNTPCPGGLLYMPPEVVVGKNEKAHFTDRSDIFSLGVVMLVVCTQEEPTSGGGKIGSEAEVERREADLAKVPDDHPLKPPIYQCLKDLPRNRPSIVELFRLHLSPTLFMFEMFKNEKNEFKSSVLLGLEEKRFQSSELPDLPVATISASAVVIDQAIYIGGGECYTSEEERDVQMYSSCSGQWRVLPAAPTRQSQLTCVGDELTLLGGLDGSTEDPTNAAITWVQKKQKWVSKLPPMPDARHHFAIFHYGNLMFLMGGKGAGYSCDTSTSILVFNKQSHKWSSPTFSLPQPMHSPTACLSSGYVFIAYSRSMYKIPVDDLQETVTKQQMKAEWIKVHPNPFDRSALLRHSDYPLLVGGCIKQREPTPNITLYNPTTDEWSTVCTSGVPRAMACALAISSSTFLVMGGCLSFDPHPCKESYITKCELFRV